MTSPVLAKLLEQQKKLQLKLQAQQQAIHEQIEQVRNAERSGVVQRLAEAMRDYAITPTELMRTMAKLPPHGAEPRAETEAPELVGSIKRARFVRYRHPDGRTWSGQGTVPGWARDYPEGMEALRVSPEDLEAQMVAAKAGQGDAPPSQLETTTEAALDALEAAKASPGVEVFVKAPRQQVVKYTDGQGNEWGGGGSMPRWLRLHVQAGADPNAFLVPGARPVPELDGKAALSPSEAQLLEQRRARDREIKRKSRLKRALESFTAVNAASEKGAKPKAAGKH